MLLTTTRLFFASALLLLVAAPAWSDALGAMERVLAFRFAVPQITPQASTSARAAVKVANAPKPDQLPLQVRLPRKEVRAIKVAAAEQELTVSEFMLACFHAYMKSGKHD